jgi:hypothetical protein
MYAFVCSAGHLDLAARWYERLYRLHLVSHWLGANTFHRAYLHDEEGKKTATAEREDPATRSVLDLQGFSRGMAYGAIRSAIAEVPDITEMCMYCATLLDMPRGAVLQMRARGHVMDLTVTIQPYKDLASMEDARVIAMLLERTVGTEQDIRSVLESFTPPLSARFDPAKPDRMVVVLSENGAH